MFVSENMRACVRMRACESPSVCESACESACVRAYV